MSFYLRVLKRPIGELAKRPFHTQQAGNFKG